MANGTVGDNSGGTSGDPFDIAGAISPDRQPNGAVDPASLGNDTGTGSDSGNGSGAGNGDAPKRKRGRPAGSRNGKPSTSQKSSLDISGIEKMLLGVHTMGAILLASPELALTESEAHAVAQASVNVAQYYDLTADPKTLAWINFGFVMAGVYGSKAFAVYGRKKREKKDDKPRRDDNVINGVFTGGSPGLY